MRSPTSRSFLATVGIVASVATVVALATTSIANHAGGHHVENAKRATKVVALSGERAQTISTDEWVDIRGAKTSIRVPDGERALISARFTAETVCYAIFIENCSLRIMVDARQARPASGRDFHVDSNYSGESEESQKGHALDRTLKVGPGRYTIKVQGTQMGITNLRVDDWSLIVKRISV
jgi:ABC-type antimicrobial peptide transport system permease subunit